MAGEFQASYTTGSTLYAILRNAAGEVYNGSVFDATPTTGEWASYDIALTEDASTGLYRGTMPAVAAGAYTFEVRLQAGGSPAATDRVVGQGALMWSGTTSSEDRLARSAGQVLPGVVDTSSFAATVTQFESSSPLPPQLDADFFKDATIYFEGGDLAGQRVAVTAWSSQGGGTRGRFTVTSATRAPINGQKFLVI